MGLVPPKPKPKMNIKGNMLHGFFKKGRREIPIRSKHMNMMRTFCVQIVLRDTMRKKFPKGNPDY